MKNRYLEPDDDEFVCVHCEKLKIAELCDYHLSPYHEGKYFCSDACCEAWEDAHEDEVAEYIEQEGE